MEVRVRGKFTQQVMVDSIDVVQELLNKAIGINNWLNIDDGKYYQCWETCSRRNWEEKKEITKEVYDYASSLVSVLEYLKK